MNFIKRFYLLFNIYRIKSKNSIFINSNAVEIPSTINRGLEISVFRVTHDSLKIEGGDLFSVFRKDDSRIELVLSSKYSKKVNKPGLRSMIYKHFENRLLDFVEI